MDLTLHKTPNERNIVKKVWKTSGRTEVFLELLGRNK